MATAKKQLENLSAILGHHKRSGESITTSCSTLGFGKNYFYQGIQKYLNLNPSDQPKVIKDYLNLKNKEPKITNVTPFKNPIIHKPFVGNPDNILVIGDTHWPFCREGYMEHCRDTMIKYNCGKVVHIGDSVDNHYSSFHSTDPDGYGAGEELDRVIDIAAKWNAIFPDVDQVIGNHDQIILRKAFASGLSKRWIKDFGDVLKLSGWRFHTSITIHGVHFTHGTGTGGGRNAAMNRAMQLRTSVVQGHFHTTAGVEWNVSKKDRIFGFQVGCGIDDEAYAFAYAKDNPKKNIISCGVILDKGKIPILVPMEL